MSLSLHHLRYKIAAAAVIKGAVRRTSRVPGARGLVAQAADRLRPGGEATGSYRGLAAGLLKDALGEDTGGEALAYDAVAGLVPAGAADSVPDVEHLRAQAEEDPSAGVLIALAAALRKSYVADFEASAEAYERAFEANPADLRAVEGALVSGARSHYDWPRIWAIAGVLKPRKGALGAGPRPAGLRKRLSRFLPQGLGSSGIGARFWDTMGALFTPDPEPVFVERAVELLEEQAEHIPSLNQLLIETLAVRLQLLGRFRTGARLRESMARNRIRELHGIPVESALWLKHLLGAYAFLDDDRLHRTAARPPLDLLGPQALRQTEKLRADVSFWDGEVKPLQAHAADRAEESRAWGITMPGEHAMENLVAGKRIAVVGPAAGEADCGELIDSYDVVVRTNLRRPVPQEHHSRTGSRTDLSYYAALDLMRHWDDVGRLAAEGHLLLAVTRPHLLPVVQPVPEWLRVARFEFGLYFRGAPLGIQRILYDLLQFAPAEIGLFHADFYAGTRTAASGYRDDALRFGPHSQANDPVVMHDLGFEFRLVQRLVRAGHVQPYGSAAEVLALGTQEYLARLEDRGAFLR